MVIHIPDPFAQPERKIGKKHRHLAVAGLLGHQDGLLGFLLATLGKPGEGIGEGRSTGHLPVIVPGSRHHEHLGALLHPVDRMAPADLRKLGPQAVVLEPAVRLGGDRVVAPHCSECQPEGFCSGNIGGFVAAELKRAGFDAVIIEGKAAAPVYLWIHDDRAELLDASTLWGLGVYRVEELLKEGARGAETLVDYGPCLRRENCLVLEDSGEMSCLTDYDWKNGRLTEMARTDAWRTLDGAPVVEAAAGCVLDETALVTFCFSQKAMSAADHAVLAAPVE